VYAFQQKNQRGNLDIMPAEDNTELLKMDTHYKRIIEAERQSFEIILQRKINVAQRDAERKYEKQIKDSKKRV
jgi:hypothetical protein